jgi:tRNA-splicing ligase RtcB
MKIVAKNLEPEALSQFHACMNDPSAIDGALMADAHTGYTLPIGGVILSKGKVFPSYVGFDIGCGMCAVLTDLERKDVEPRKKEIFDKIYEEVPCGEGKSGKRANVHPDTLGEHTDFAQSIWESNSNQLGTLGGGNHFIEIGYDETDRVWVIVHSGSRGLGYKIGDHYMRLAKRSDIDTSEFEKEFDRTHADLKKHNPEKY